MKRRRDSSIHPIGQAPGDTQVRDAHAILAFAEQTCLTDDAPPTGRIGIETEWFVLDSAEPAAPVPPERTRAALGPDDLPGGSRVTFEPGGQLELSGPPLPLPGALRAMSDDLATARDRLAVDGLLLAGLGADPLRPPCRLLTEGRYAAMARYFEAGGFPAGRQMMCSTAALQVNVDAGPAAGWVDRWRLAHALGPMLLATFAASPVLAGRPAGRVSARHGIWADIDPTRTAPVPSGGPSLSPARQWARYLLDARLMLVRDGDGHRAVLGPVTFADWIDGRGPLDRPPTIDDLAYHATTVFPPVRPRGWLELRYLDAQPVDTWPVATTVTTALLDDPAAADIAAWACRDVADHWDRAAAVGLADPDLHRAAVTCLAAALEAAPRLGADPAMVAAVAAFADTSVRPGRCPADGLLESWRATGAARLLIDAAGGEARCVPTA
jgi:glutamate--cysteine ligase